MRVHIAYLGEKKFRASVEGDDALLFTHLPHTYTSVLSEDDTAHVDFELGQHVELEAFFQRHADLIDREFVDYTDAVERNDISALPSAGSSTRSPLPRDDDDDDEDEDDDGAKRIIFALAEEGKNVLIVGEPGTGKSRLLAEVAEHVGDLKRSFQVTAMTAIAADNINTNTNGAIVATTLHHVLGITPDDVSKDMATLLRDQKRRAKVARQRGIHTPPPPDILFIDEVSLMSARMFRILKSLLPTAQLIAFGDPAQLPPVATADAPPGSAEYFFEDDGLFNDTFGTNTVELTKNHRLANAEEDPEDERMRLQFMAMIHECHTVDGISAESQEMLESMSTLHRDVTPEHTRIYARNVDVDSANDEAVRKLSRVCKTLTPTVTYTRTDPKSVAIEEASAETPTNLAFDDMPVLFQDELQKKYLPRSTPLTIARGAQIRLNTNMCLKRQLVNGTMGTVSEIEVHDNEEKVTCKFGKKTVALKRTQLWRVSHTDRDGIIYTAECWRVPLDLASAMTAHKAIGLSLDYVYIDFDHMGEDNPGVGYVAISRATSVKNVVLHNVDQFTGKLAPKVAAFYDTVRENMQAMKAAAPAGGEPVEFDAYDLPSAPARNRKNYVTLSNSAAEFRKRRADAFDEDE